MTTAEDLVGTWRLLDFAVLVDGKVHGRPLGDDPVGQIMYHPSRHMSALMMSRNRPWRLGASFLEVRADDRSAAALDFVGYGGRYELANETVVHHVDVALDPELVGRDLVRTISWADDDLVPETEEVQTRSRRSR